MCCFVLLFVALGPRFAILAMWLFGSRVELAFDTWLLASPRVACRSLDDVDVPPHVVRVGRRVGGGLDPRRDRGRDRRRHVRRQAGAESLRTGLASGASLATPRILVVAAALVAAARQAVRPRESTSYAFASIRSRAGPIPTTSRRPATEGLVHGAGVRRARLARTRRRASRGSRRSAAARRRTASSSARTEPRGSPTAASTRSFGSTRGPRRVRRFPLPETTGYANLNTATFDARRRPLVHGAERDLR